jgi:hypothetical protein
VWNSPRREGKGGGKDRVEEHLVVQRPALHEHRPDLAVARRAVRDEEQRSQHVAWCRLQVGKEPGERARDHHGGGDPVDRSDPLHAFAQEARGRDRPPLGDDRHDEAADHEEHVDPGSADGQVSAGAFGGVEGDDGQCGHRPQVLDTLKLCHQASRNRAPAR